MRMRVCLSSMCLTLLVNLLAGQVGLVAHEAAEDAREEVPVARAAGVAGGMVGGAAQVVVVVAPGDVAAGRHWRGCETSWSAELRGQDWGWGEGIG